VQPRDTLTLVTLYKFTEEELTPHLSFIEKQVKMFYRSISLIDQEETWTKLILPGGDTHQFSDGEDGMDSLQMEHKSFHEGLRLASTHRYVTHLDK
jgi:hypothetical protein